MDKRWLSIIIILIVGVTCMYVIAESSDSVGSAITIVNKTVVTLPDGFTIGADESNSAKLIQKNGDKSIFIKDMGKKNKAEKYYKESLKQLKSSDYIILLSNSTTKINNNPIYKIDTVDVAKGHNITVIFAYAAKHTFTIKMECYDNPQQLDDDLSYLINTMKSDYKQID